MAELEDAETSVGREPDSSIVRWLQEAVGPAVLPYLFGCEPEDVEAIRSGEREPAAKQAEVIHYLNQFRQDLPNDLGEAANTEAPRWWLTHVGQDGKSVARSIHEHVTDADAVPPTADELERSLCELAFDSYPAYLFSRDHDLPDNFLVVDRPSIRVSSLLMSLPETKVFEQLVLRDELLGAAFKTRDEHSGAWANIYRSDGSGGGVQLMMLADMLLTRAWNQREEAARTPTAFATAAIEELRLVRQLFSGRAVRAKVLTAFTGVLLPPGKELRIRDGVVRAVTETDRKYVPDQIKGQLTTSDSTGNTTVINYDGDVLLETNIPYRIRPMPAGNAAVAEWPEDMRSPESLDTTSTRLRFSLLLALQRESRVQLVQTWRSFDAPLSTGRMMSWADPRHGTALMPTQLTEAELAEWEEWYKRLSLPYVAKIDVALTRILRALAERREPSDVLIDAVIAWETYSALGRASQRYG